MRLSSGRSEPQRGATVVEFAVIMPLLLLLIFGIVEFARVITEFTTIRTAAREGARYATTVDDSDGIPNYTDCQAIINAAQAKAVVGDLETITVQWDVPDGSTFACDDSSISNPDQEDILSGTSISVEVTTTFDSVVPLLEVFLDGISISSEQSRQVFKGVIEE